MLRYVNFIAYTIFLSLCSSFLLRQKLPILLCAFKAAKNSVLKADKVSFPLLSNVSVIFLLGITEVCLAQNITMQDTLESVMGRMKPEGVIQIAYQETRYMGLFDDDWQGSGYLYVAIPEVMLKQQLKPDIEIMAAEGRQLLYHKPATQTFHHAQLDESNPMMASLAAFKAMLSGNLLYLRQVYELKFSVLESSWTLEMTAKEFESDEVPLKIVMQGLSGQPANQMAVVLPDGDRSAYVLSQPQRGSEIQQTLEVLLQSLKGH